jgi:hypothetical protein
VVVGHRQAHRDLAIVLLAELAAVLARHADGVLALLREAGVVDDPVPHRPVPLEGGQDPAAHRGQHRRVIPLGLGHDMMQRLVPGLHPSGLDPGRHGLHALARPGSSSPVQ